MSHRPAQITIASPKGGVGKTMATILLAGEFAAAGYRVDVKQCLGLIRHIRSLGGRHREIAYGVMINMVGGIEHNTMAFRTLIALLQQAEARILDAFLSQRPTFAAIATAGSLYEIEGSTKAINDARDQTNALAAEITRILNGGNEPDGQG